MECNKDKAIRAKELARKKMQDNDFVGARKIALKAQQLFPELENISHLLAVCHVHCSAQNNILGPDKDWYSILQVANVADEATIKKQYRRLALLLHPDENNFPGAEAAFKLIGVANVVLSDRGKRSLYDSKLGISIKSGQAKPPTQHGNKNPSTRKPHVFQNNTVNGFSYQFNGPNRATRSNPSVGQESFWTCCPFCNIRYQHYRDFVNRVRRCQKCSKPFIAYDIAAQGVSPKASLSQAATPVMSPKAGPNRAATQGVPPGTNQSPAAAPGVPPRTNQSRAATQSVPPRSNASQASSSWQEVKPLQGCHRTVKKETVDFLASGSGSQGVGFDSGTQMRSTHVVGSDLKTQKSTKSAGRRSQGVTTLGTDQTKREEDANFKDKKRKRGKLEVESSECYDSSCSPDSEDTIIEDSVSDIAAGQKSGVTDIYGRRRYSRQKHQVTYMESKSEDGDLDSPLKRREGKSSIEKRQQEGLVEDDPQCHTPPKQKKRSDPPTEANKNHTTELPAGAPDNGAKPVEIDDSESDASSEDEEAPVVVSCPEPEFNDFYNDKAQSCFAVDQFWACYGNEDGMPRYYAHIKKVYSTGFKLRVIWLEPDPDNEDEIEWVDTELPVSCGKYRHGEYQDTTYQTTFSHQIICEKDKKGSFYVYPRKGEIWALFKDWNIKWSTEPGKHASYKFEIVEVLSDFVEGVGIRTVLLDKVRGFISLFYHGSQNRTGEFVIPPDELYRFSHRIPFFKMIGTERKGVPEGSFELDPASLPANLDDISYPSLFKMDNKTLGTRGHSLRPELSPGRSNSKMSDTLVTPKTSDQCNGERVSDGESSVFRGSSRGVNTGYKENKQVNASCVSSQCATANNLNGKEGRSCNAEVSSHQDDSSPRRRNVISSSISPSCTVALDQFHDFKSDRSPDKFKEGQIWAKMTNQYRFEVPGGHYDFIQKCFEEVVLGREYKEKELEIEKELVESSQKSEETQLGLIQDKGLGVLKRKKKDIDLIIGDVKVREESFNEKEKLVLGFLQRIELGIEEFGSVKKFMEELFDALVLKEKQVEVDSKELNLISNEIERKAVEIRTKEEDLETCKKEFESSVKALSLRVEKIEAKEKEIEAVDMRLVSRMEEFAGKEKEFESKAVETREKEENLERCRENLESKENDLCLRTEKLEGKDREIKAREIYLDSRKKEQVVKEDDLERKRVEFRKQSENLETCKKKLEFEENDLSLRTGRLAAKEKQVEAREMVLSSREAELIVKQKEIEKNAFDIRKKSENLETCKEEFESKEKDLSLRTKKLGAKEKEIEGREMDLDSRMEELERKADEIRKKEKSLERCRTKIEYTKQALLSRREELEAKDEGIEAREAGSASRMKELRAKEEELALRERYLNMKSDERNESATSVDDEERACKLPKLDSADPRKRLEFRSKGKKRSRVCKDIVPISPKEGTVCTNLAEMSLDKSEMHYSDPEFHDFDEGRKKGCLAVDQFWACYDRADAMPRFYMQIKKVYSRKFKVQITWLKVDPQYRFEVDAFVKDLPVSCGKFISGNSEVILDPRTLSHQIHCKEDRNKGFYVIVPRKGEIWALYKDLHIKKKSNSRSVDRYEYEIVVVLSDFVEPTGIRVAYLNKLEGYVSLFRREKGSTSFLIRPNNLFKFSHQIPSYPLDGTEREGVPDGCFELDPACLPPKCDNFSSCQN